MEFEILIKPEVDIDLQDAYDWYELQSEGLGIRFYQKYKEAIESLKSNPFFQIRYKNVRCLPLKKFPFMLHFTIDEKESVITIYAVIHTSLHPKHWKRKA